MQQGTPHHPADPLILHHSLPGRGAYRGAPARPPAAGGCNLRRRADGHGTRAFGWPVIPDAGRPPLATRRPGTPHPAGGGAYGTGTSKTGANAAGASDPSAPTPSMFSGVIVTMRGPA